MKRLLTVALTTLVAGYVAVCVLLFTQQRKILFPRPASTAPAISKVPPSGTVVVHFHGNAEAAGDLAWLEGVYAPHGLVTIEYPGYGALPGEPSEAAIYAAAEAQLKALGVPNERLVLVGQSIGTGPAVEMAKRGWGTKLVLLTPFTSVPDAAQLAFPWLPARWLVRDVFDSAAKAPAVKVPVLVIHGDQDEVIPFELGKRLAPLFPSGTFMPVPGGHHNDLWSDPAVVAKIRAFL